MSEITELTPGERVLLRDFIIAILAEREKQGVDRWQSHSETHRTLEVALANNEALRIARDAASNEWRGTLNDTLNRSVQRESFDARNREVDVRTSNLENRLSNLEGRLTGAISILSFLIITVGLVEHFLPH